MNVASRFYPQTFQMSQPIYPNFYAQPPWLLNPVKLIFSHLKSSMKLATEASIIS